MNTSTGVISGTPVAAGASNVAISATNAQGTGSAVLVLTVNSPPPPTITSALAVSATRGMAFSYTITASGSPTSYGATGLPAGLTVNTSTGVISGTPTAVGSSNVTISATNAQGTGSAALALVVSNPVAPIITSSLTADGSLGAPFAYTITASGGPTSFNATGLPAGLSVNTSTGAITGTPSAAGVTSVGISATNALGTDTKTLSLTVTTLPAAIAHYTFDNGTATDSSGNSNNGTLVGSPPRVAGRVGAGALSFNGSAQYVEIPNTTSLQYGDTFSYSLWIKRGAINVNPYSIVLSKGANSAVLWIGADNLPKLSKHGTGTPIATSTTAIADIAWHHLAVTKSGATVKMYLDGADVTGTVTNLTTQPTTTVLRIATESPNPGQYTGASIDDVWIFNTALSPGQVDTLRGRGQVPSAPPNLRIINK